MAAREQQQRKREREREREGAQQSWQQGQVRESATTGVSKRERERETLAAREDRP